MTASTADNTVYAEAEHRRAMFAAEGAGVTQSWQAALDHALNAAEAGHRVAQAELAAMAGDWALAQAALAGEDIAPDACRALRASVDIAHWLETPPPQIISATPRIATIRNFASPDICRWVIARAQPRLDRAKVYDPTTGGPGHESVRDNRECHFLREDSDLALLALRARIARATKLPVLSMEATAVLHYLPGQQFLPHFDFLDTKNPGYAKEVSERGQRVVTFLLCLNEDYEGGETQFTALGRRYKGHTGNAIFFWNVEPNGVPDRRTAHAGLPPTRGEKWMMSQWIRERR